MQSIIISYKINFTVNFQVFLRLPQKVYHNSKSQNGEKIFKYAELKENVNLLMFLMKKVDTKEFSHIFFTHLELK